MHQGSATYPSSYSYFRVSKSRLSTFPSGNKRGKVERVEVDHGQRSQDDRCLPWLGEPAQTRPVRQRLYWPYDPLGATGTIRRPITRVMPERGGEDKVRIGIYILRTPHLVYLNIYIYIYKTKQKNSMREFTGHVSRPRTKGSQTREEAKCDDTRRMSSTVHRERRPAQPTMKK